MVHDALASSPIVELAPPGCERIDVGKRAGKHTMPQDEITALLVRLGREGKRVVRLKGGDVFVFARGGEEAAALRAGGVAFEVIPGVSSALAAPAYAGIPVTHRDHTTSFTVATGHEDPTKGASTLDFAKLANPSQTLVLLMAMGNLRAIARALVARGLPPTTPTAVVRDGTTPRQRTVVATLETIADEVERAGVGAPAIVVIGSVVNEREATRWFDRSGLFGSRVLVTRAHHQGIELATRLYEYGAQPVVAPTIAIGSPDDPAELARAIVAVRAYSWLVLTSRNGVDALFARLDADARDARALGDVRVAAIGSGTAAALRARGVRADLVPDRFVSETIADELISQTTRDDRLLIFGAQEGRDVVRERLRGAGRHVDAVAAYRTRILHDETIAQAARSCDTWTFTSPSTVEGLAANLPSLAEESLSKRVACLGPIAADAARRHGLHVDILPQEATIDALIEALAFP